MSEYSYVKGHGTENDFVLLPDANGRHELTPSRWRGCATGGPGIGGDGVIRVVRTDATEDPAAVRRRGEAIWFMDYRNADGSLSEMCGNGIRVLGHFLATHADVDPRNPLPIATRAGVKTLTFDAATGSPSTWARPRCLAPPPSRSAIAASRPGTSAWATRTRSRSSTTSPTPDPLLEAPGHDAALYPDGVNVEFVVRRGEHHVAMRVHERGSGETRSCGTGACAVMVAAALADERRARYAVHDRPARRHSEIVWTEDDRILMTGPAVLTAEGVTNL